VTIDPDTEALLKDEVVRTGQSFKAVLNQAVKRALGGRHSDTVQAKPLFSAPFPTEYAAASFNRLADEWDDADTVKELSS